MTIHSSVRYLCPSSKALPFSYAFTDCDTVPACVGNCKKTAWLAWNVFENATEVCRCLSSLCDSLTKNEIGVFEEFVAIVFDRSTNIKTFLLVKMTPPHKRSGDQPW